MPQHDAHIPETPHRQSAVQRLLADLEHRERFGRFVAKAAWILSAVFVLSAVLIAIDASYRLESVGRIAGLCLYPMVIAALLLYPRRGRNRPGHARSRQHYARQAEVACHLEGNELINAVLLSAQADGLAAVRRGYAGTLTASLVNRAVALGETTADCVIPGQVVPRRDMRTALSALALIGTAIALLLIPFHRVAMMVIPRFVAPLAEHPAFTWLDFDIETEPSASAILVGDDLQITAAIRNTCWWNQMNLPAASSVRLLRWSSDHVGESPIPMAFEPVQGSAAGTGESSTTEVSARRFRARLRDMQHPVVIAVDTPMGRSRSITLTPMPIPRIRAITVKVQPPIYVPEPVRRTVTVSNLAQTIKTYPQSTIEVQVQAGMDDCRLEIARLSPPWSSGPDLSWNMTATEQGSTEFTATCTPTVLGHYEYELRLVHSVAESEHGSRMLSSKPVVMRVSVVPDVAPTAEILVPGQPAMCLATQTVALQVHVADDIGLSSVSLSAQALHEERTDPDAGEYAFSLEATDRAEEPVQVYEWEIDNDRRTDMTSDCLIRLDALDLVPGDVVLCRVIARDDHPETEAHTTLSQPAYLLIIDPELYGHLVDYMQGNGQPEGPASTGGEGSPPAASDPGDGLDSEQTDAPQGQDAGGEEPMAQQADNSENAGGQATDEGQQQQQQQAGGQPTAEPGSTPAGGGGALPDLDGLMAGRGLYGPDAWPIQSQQTRQSSTIDRETRVSNVKTDPSDRHPPSHDTAVTVPDASRGVVLITDPLDSGSRDSRTADPTLFDPASPGSARSLRLVPLPYRDLASRYLLRLLEDEQQSQSSQGEGRQ